MGTWVPQPSQVMSWVPVVVVASMVCSFGGGPGGGVWICGVFRCGRTRRRNRAGVQLAGPAGQDVFPAVLKETSGGAGPGICRVREKDLERLERAEREAGCAPGRGCEADKSVHAAGPATGARHGAQAPVVARTFSWRCCLQRW